MPSIEERIKTLEKDSLKHKHLGDRSSTLLDYIKTVKQDYNENEILQVNSGKALVLRTVVEAGLGSKIEIVTTNVIVVNTTTETNLISVSIPANILGTANGIRVRLVLSDISTNATTNLTIKLKYGGTTLATIAVNTISNSDDGQKGIIDILLLATGATNSQEGSMLLDTGINRIHDGTSGGAGDLIRFTDFGTAAEDSTGALNLVVTVQWSVANAGNTITMAHAIIEKIT